MKDTFRKEPKGFSSWFCGSLFSFSALFKKKSPTPLVFLKRGRTTTEQRATEQKQQTVVQYLLSVFTSSKFKPQMVNFVWLKAN